MCNKKENLMCSLCGKKIEKTNFGWEFGNNPFPLMRKESDRCCDDCNSTFVIPTRLLMIGCSKLPTYKQMVNKKGWLNNIERTMKLIKTYSNK